MLFRRIFTVSYMTTYTVAREVKKFVRHCVAPSVQPSAHPLHLRRGVLPVIPPASIARYNRPKENLESSYRWSAVEVEFVSCFLLTRAEPSHSPTTKPVPPPETDQARWFTDEVQPHEPSLRAYLRGSFPTVRDIDDVVQESYLRIWRRQAEKPIDSVKSFFFTIARHLALGTLRRESRSPISAVMDLAATSVIDEGPNAAESACSREEIEFLFAAISALPARTREVYLLRKFEGLSQQEIAVRLGISPNTVEVHVGRANKRCEHYLRMHGAFDSRAP